MITTSTKLHASETLFLIYLYQEHPKPNIRKPTLYKIESNCRALYSKGHKQTKNRKIHLGSTLPERLF